MTSSCTKEVPYSGETLASGFDVSWRAPTRVFGVLPWSARQTSSVKRTKEVIRDQGTNATEEIVQVGKDTVQGAG
jgi:hypothetical protein